MKQVTVSGAIILLINAEINKKETSQSVNWLLTDQLIPDTIEEILS